MFPFVMFLITALLAGLKVAGYIAISWWVVFAPVMFWAALALLVAAFSLVMMAFVVLRQ